jgi:ADP-ribose pyrophosphatase
VTPTSDRPVVGAAPAGSDADPGPEAGGSGNPAFTVTGERTVWTGFRIHAAVAEVVAPDGSTVEREIVHHPGAVAALPLHDDGTVTLVRQYRVAVDDDIWEIPAGLRDVDGEPTVETARRELAEEAGLRAEQLAHLAAFHNSPGFSDEVIDIYLATGLVPVPDDRQGVEEQHMAIARVPLDRALAMVDDGRITDAKTVIALLTLARQDPAARGAVDADRAGPGGP